MIRFAAIATTLIALAFPSAGMAITLNPADQATVAKAEEYLNGLRSLKSRFAQDSSGGGFAQGMLYLRRPGRLRLDYEPPTQVQIFADGIWLIYVDKELEEVTQVPLESTLAGFLVRKNIALSGKITVTAVERGRGGIVRVQLIQTDEPDAGTLTLNFSEAPFALRSWTVSDAQGITTRVTLIGPEINPALKSELFRFDASKYDTPVRE